jgi:hypothetical protein
MKADPSIVLILSAVLGIAVALTLMLVGVLWAWVRSFHVEETTRRVDDLTRRQRSIEALLGQIEASREPVAEPTGTSGSAVRLPQGPRSDRAAPSAVAGPTLIAVPSLTAAPADTSDAAAAELAERFGAIWALADAGQTPEAIARSTGQPIGQVELILGLRRQLSSQTGGRSGT